MIIKAIAVLGLIGFLFAILLAYLSKRLNVEEDPKVSKILEILPGLNCGACGFSGCRAFAEAVVGECKIFSGCLPGGQELNDKIAAMLGVSGYSGVKSRVVVCSCGAQSTEKKASNQYLGPESCRAAQITGGAIDCVYGCFGFNDCVEVCPVGALSLENRKIKVDISKCTGCGQCIKACPRKLFKLVSLSKDTGVWSVACSNKEKAINVKKVCSRGCIGCTICTRVTESPFFMKGTLSYIDYSKANRLEALEEAKNKCPTKCIFKIDA